MTLVGVFAVVCDGCGKKCDETSEHMTSVRVASTKAGWELSRDTVAHRAVDRCPSCAVRPAMAVPSVPSAWACAECEASYHEACTGWAWDFDADAMTQCQCPVAHR